MCEYCVQHGAGRRWYLNARNLSKELATSDLVRDFAVPYFSRSSALGPDGFSSRQERAARPIRPGEKEAVFNRYRSYLHHQVITTEEVVQILGLSSNQTEDHERSVVRFPCICRHTSIGKEKVLHCFGIAFTHLYTRRFPYYLGGRHEYLSPDEAVEIITKMAEDERVVHAVSAVGVPYAGMICNCDMDVCHPYLHRVRLGIPEPFHKGHYVTSVDEHRCTGCGACEEACPFGAIVVSPTIGAASVDADSCYGCGICGRICPEGALRLQEGERKSGF